MKKLIIILLMAVTTVFASLALAACDLSSLFGIETGSGTIDTPKDENGSKGDTACTHSYVIKVTNPTATTEGSINETCEKCGDKKTTVLPALGVGNYVIKSPDTATCSAGGAIRYEIALGGKTYFVNVNTPATGKHTYVGDTCSLCGSTNPNSPTHTHSYVIAKNDDTHHWKECSCADKKDVAAHTFDAGEVTVAATCVADGVKTQTCTGCNKTKTTVINKTAEHEYGIWQKVDEANHSRSCKTVGCTQKQTTAHSYGNGVVTLYTSACVTETTTTYTCSVCSATKNETQTTEKHSFGVWFSVDDTKHRRDCNNQCFGCFAFEEAEHKIVNNVCNVCGYIGNIIVGNLKFELVRVSRSVSRMVAAPTEGDHAVVIGFAGAAVETIEIPAYIEVNGTDYPVTEVAENAFAGCTALKKLYFQDTLIKIGMGAFNSSGLEAINGATQSTFAAVEEIGENAFFCTKLRDITIPNSVTVIGRAAFGGIDTLTNIVIHSSFVGTDMFRACSNVNGITIGHEVVTIKQGGFVGCAKVVKIYMYDDSSQPMSLTTIESGAFSSNSNGLAMPIFNFRESKAWWDGLNKATDWIVGSKKHAISCKIGTASAESYDYDGTGYKKK